VPAHDPVALAEIDLYGELMIAAAAAPGERLPADRIDEVLRVVRSPEGRVDRYHDRCVDRYYELTDPPFPAQVSGQIPAQVSGQVPAQGGEPRY